MNSPSVDRHVLFFYSNRGDDCTNVSLRATIIMLVGCQVSCWICDRVSVVLVLGIGCAVDFGYGVPS